MNHRIILLNLVIKHLLPLEETHGMHIFLDDSPHVYWMNFRVFAEKWSSNDNPMSEDRLFYDSEGPIPDEDCIIKIREELIQNQEKWLASKEERKLKAIQELEDKLKELKQ